MSTSEAKIGQIISVSLPLLSREIARKEVLHFYEHGEFEMAFEGLLLELMSEDRRPVEFSFEEWGDVIREIGLDKQSVFDSEFWPKFQAWAQISPSTKD